jgi:hypothetical protein
MDEATLEYYEKYAAVIAPGYDAASAGVSALFPFVFKPGQRGLDIGADSGRDMARLLSWGSMPGGSSRGRLQSGLGTRSCGRRCRFGGLGRARVFAYFEPIGRPAFRLWTPDATKY